MQLPDRRPTTTTGQPTNDQAQQLINAVNDALAEQATSYRDTSPVPTVGTALPVPQPGRPPMSQRAADTSALMLSGGVATVLVGGGVSLVMVASGSADPVVCGIIFGAPTILVLALARLMKRTKDAVEAAPPVTHQHYNGSVTHTTEITTQTRGMFSRTRNELGGPTKEPTR
jgi:hypothetical protein